MWSLLEAVPFIIDVSRAVERIYEKHGVLGNEQY